MIGARSLAIVRVTTRVVGVRLRAQREGREALGRSYRVRV